MWPFSLLGKGKRLIAYGVAVALVIYMAFNTFGTKVYLFHSPTCPHCVKLMPEWEIFAENTSCSFIRAHKINTRDPKNEKMASNFGITTVPRIVKVKPNGVREEYKGERTAVEITKWARS